jgi:hypothetical protein
LYLLMRFNCISCLHVKFLQVLLEEVLTINGIYFRFFLMKEKANLYRKVIIVKNQTLILSSPVECSRKCVWFVNVRKQAEVCEVYQAMIFTFAPCMLLHLLCSKPTHALLLNTLSHPHFKTLELLKNVL